MAASDAVAGTIFIQDKHLAGTEPTLWETQAHTQHSFMASGGASEPENVQA